MSSLSVERRAYDGRPSEGRRSTAAPIIGAGGLVLIIGTMLPWASNAAAGTASRVNTSISGSSFSDGRIAMGLGFAMLVIALVMFTTRRVGAWFDADLLGLALATTAGVVTIATWTALNSSAGDAVSRSADTGLYVAVAGSVIAFAGALAGLMRSGSDRATDHRDNDVVETEVRGNGALASGRRG
jgi:hypothetical protein